MHKRFAHLAMVTAKVALIGAVAMAVSSALAIVLLQAFMDSLSSALTGEMLWIATQAALVGGVFGAVAMPLVGWALLRRVPLGIAALTTLGGAVVGGAIGQVIAPLDPYSPSMPGAFAGILAGYLAAGVVLGLVYRRFRAGAPPPNEELKPTASPSSLVE